MAKSLRQAYDYWQDQPDNYLKQFFKKEKITSQVCSTGVREGGKKEKAKAISLSPFAPRSVPEEAEPCPLLTISSCQGEPRREKYRAEKTQLLLSLYGN